MTTELDFEGLQELLWAFAGQRTVTTASRCGILGRLAERAWEPAGLAVDLGLDPEACDRVVRALVALGVARREGTTFRLVPDLEPLFQPGPDDLAPFLEHSHRMYENWGENLETWLRTGRWPRRERSPEETLAFARAMRGIGVRTAREIVDRLDLEGVRRVLDIGGSLGHWAETLCRRSPDIRVTVFDIPEVARAGTDSIRGTTFEDRIEFVGGDYLEDDLGSGFDLVLLANVVHQELRPRAERLIDRAAAALAPGGRLCVVDFRIDPDRCAPPMGTLFAIHMRDFGNTWTEEDLRSWMEAAGLDDIERTDTGPVRWVITGYRP